MFLFCYYLISFCLFILKYQNALETCNHNMNIFGSRDFHKKELEKQQLLRLFFFKKETNNMDGKPVRCKNIMKTITGIGKCGSLVQILVCFI